MRRLFRLRAKGIVAGLAVFACALAGNGGLAVQAEGASGYYDASGLYITQTDSAGISEGTSGGVVVDYNTSDVLTGSYTVVDGWSQDMEVSTDEVVVYYQDAYQDAAVTSTISCTYMDTNYSVLDYEQLRDMLTNNLLYSNVNAQISTSAVYTLAKDYLYIVLVDDSAEDYRDIYHYVVGDYRCFCVQVKEYRSEAAQAQALEQDTPQEAGRKIAESFVWDIH